jgi:tRNA pseudouridine38-40 synthase
VYQSGRLVVIDVSANAFLHHMVRNIAGVLMAVGAGDRSPDWALEVLQARDRRQGGVTAPPDGLYFVDVRYPDIFRLPPSDPGPYFLS